MIKNVLKRQTILITITVITLCIGLLGVSYAVFFSVNDGKEQTVTSGDLVIQFQEDKETITTASVPQNDTDGKNNSYTFSVTNVGSLPMIYDIYLYEDPEAKSGEGVTMIPHEWLKIQLDEEEVKTLKALEEQEGNTVIENDITKIKINTNKLFVAAKTGTESTEGQVTEGNTAPNVKTHTIRIWIDEKAPESIIGNTVALQLEVFGEVGSSSQTSGSDSPKPTIKPFSEVIVADNTTIFADEAENIRYAGPSAEVNNYIWFNCNDYEGLTKDNATEKGCEKWRIIGLFKNIAKANGETDNLVKIIRADSIGTMAWDAYAGSYGSNNWTRPADLQTSLTNYYNGITLSSAKGITESTKPMIEQVTWNIGGWNTNKITAQQFYEKERGTTTYNSQPSTWPGYIGLMYPSDYGYATTGSSDGSNDRAACLNTQLYSYDSGSYCHEKDWLIDSSSQQWTLTPYSDDYKYAFYVDSTGRVIAGYGVHTDRAVRPSLYLKSNVQVASGNGSSETPYILMQE